MTFFRALALLLAAGLAANAQDFAMPEELGAITMHARALAQMPQAPAFRPNAPAPAAPAERTTAAPLDTGFKALGPTGKTGRVKGPFIPLVDTGGTYRVIESGPWKMVFDIQSGVVVGRITITRDAATGRDWLSFAGKAFDLQKGGLAPAGGSGAGAVTYSPSSDSGAILWTMNGERRTETFSGGRAGRTMTITLMGHHFHFTQD